MPLVMSIVQLHKFFTVEIKNKGAGYKPQGGISYRVEDPEASNSAPSQPVSDWTQVQQKCLENALASVPKTADDRWEEIANLVPNKTKASWCLGCLTFPTPKCSSDAVCLVFYTIT